MKYRFIEDPGHGWLEVGRAEIDRLGVSVSSYSYIRGDKVFLEEDCDMGAFMKAKEQAGEPVEMVRVYQEHTPIRNYERWGQA